MLAGKADLQASLCPGREPKTRGKWEEFIFSVEHLLCARHRARSFIFGILFVLLMTSFWGSSYQYPHFTDKGSPSPHTGGQWWNLGPCDPKAHALFSEPYSLVRQPFLPALLFKAMAGSSYNKPIVRF